MTIHRNATEFEGIVQGHVTLTIESPAKVERTSRRISFLINSLSNLGFGKSRPTQ